MAAFGHEKVFHLPRAYIDSAGSSGALSVPPQTQPVSLPGLYVQAATLSAAGTLPGSAVTVNAMLSNKGLADGYMTVKLYVNGREEASRSVMVESGTSVSLEFIVSRNEPGAYTVRVGGVDAGSFVVDAPAGSDVILYISVALILTAFALAIVYIGKSRRIHSG